MLIDRGIQVITQLDGLVHTTGHPRRDELRRLYDLLKPQTLIPVHGEAAHLEAHAKLGKIHGIPNVIGARNGDMVRLAPDPLHFPGEVRVGELYLDGNVLCTPEESGVKGRRRLMFGGHIVVSLCIDGRGGIVSGPNLFIEGLPNVEDDDITIADLVKRIVSGTLKSIPPKRRADTDLVNNALQRAVRGEVAAFWGKKPNVTVFVHAV
jgi:ribonuclease J